jgi:hypothetical protein
MDKRSSPSEKRAFRARANRQFLPIGEAQNLPDGRRRRVAWQKDAADGNRGNPVIASHLRATARRNELRRREVIDLGTSVA